MAIYKNIFNKTLKTSVLWIVTVINLLYVIYTHTHLYWEKNLLLFTQFFVTSIGSSTAAAVVDKLLNSH